MYKTPFETLLYVSKHQFVLIDEMLPEGRNIESQVNTKLRLCECFEGEQGN
jgi:hypothetical protein